MCDKVVCERVVCDKVVQLGIVVFHLSFEGLGDHEFFYDLAEPLRMTIFQFANCQITRGYPAMYPMKYMKFQYKFHEITIFDGY